MSEESVESAAVPVWDLDNLTDEKKDKLHRVLKQLDDSKMLRQAVLDHRDSLERTSSGVSREDVARVCGSVAVMADTAAQAFGSPELQQLSQILAYISLWDTLKAFASREGIDFSEARMTDDEKVDLFVSELMSALDLSESSFDLAE